MDSISFGNASSRQFFDHYAGVDSCDLSFEEIDSLRPQVYAEYLKEYREDPCILKTHDAFTFLPDGNALLCPPVKVSAIYLVRNPLDVTVSYKYHFGLENFDTAIEQMGNPDQALCANLDRLEPQLRQKLLGWSGHVRSWQRAGIPVHFMRYEDMHANPLKEFKAALRFVGLRTSNEKIAKALSLSTFNKLQMLEKSYGFREKPRGFAPFFRKGEPGSWREHLNTAQVERITNYHSEAMIAMGYLNEEQKPAN
ncbi:MAG: sulfotransferase domain-containing protein [Synoicihabitans sp.]